MRTTFAATHALVNANRVQMMKLQAELATAQKELATGRLADVGLGLGGQTGQVISLRQEYSRLEAITHTNSIVAARLEATQASVDLIAAGAEAFLAALIDGSRTEVAAKGLPAIAKSAMEALVAALNSTHAGDYLFAGINTDVRPVADYFASPASAAKQAVDDSFVANFGFAQGAPAAGAIAAADMSQFLDAGFASLFEPAGWTSAWSSASNENIRSRISPSELVSTGTNANSDGIRKLAMAYTMVVEFSAANLSDAAFQVVAEKAVGLIGSAAADLTAERAQLGAAQERVSNASNRMSIQMGVLANHVNALEAVDPYEASTRISTLMTQIETAYALTARIQKLSILNYV